MYGYYISYNDKNYKLLENIDENLSLEDTINCIEKYNSNSLNNQTNSNKTSLINKIDKYIIKNGQYGPYIEFDKKFYNIPKEYDIDKLTKENCDTIIKLHKKTYKKNKFINRPTGIDTDLMFYKTNIL